MKAKSITPDEAQALWQLGADVLYRFRDWDLSAKYQSFKNFVACFTYNPRRKPT